MKVKPRSVAAALQESGREEVAGTAQFCSMMKDFFGCSNLRSLTEHIRKRNHPITPYKSPNDERFT